MNYAKQKYKAVVVDTWMAKVIYGRTIDELNKKIDATKSNHPNLKAEIYTRDDEAETPAFAQWRLIKTREEEK